MAVVVGDGRGGGLGGGGGDGGTCIACSGTSSTHSGVPPMEDFTYGIINPKRHVYVVRSGADPTN